MTDQLRPAYGVLLPGFAAVDDDVRRLVADGLGGVCLFGANTRGDVRALVDDLRAQRPDLVVAVDEEGGDVTRLHAHDPGGSPVLGPAALGAADDLDLTEATGAAVGAELSALGIDLCLGPVADLNTDPDNPVIGTRSFGTDPARAAEHVVAWIRGLRGSGVAACAKHFPGHGDTHVDSHLALPVLAADAATLNARELVPFRAAAAAACDAIMTGHLVVPALDPAAPASLSAVVTTAVRDLLGPDRVIVTDALDMAGATVDGGLTAAAVRALLAGADLLCLGADVTVATVHEVARAVSDQVPPERLAEAARRTTSLATSRHPAERRATPVVDSSAQLRGARAALRVDGELPDLRDAVVVRVVTPGTIAVGDVDWGVPADLDVGPSADEADGVLALAAGRPVVVQVRDAHRRPEVLALLEALGSPTVVEYGWPAPWTGTGARIVTHGCSRPSAEAVAEIVR
jgi:beta-N-acetylhexosaminidase